MKNNKIVSNVRVYDLPESMVAAGYPMRTDTEQHPIDDRDMARCQNLVSATKSGNMAHAQFLTGIRVNFDLTFSNKAWVEAERYRFLEFVSSQSTMHCITKFDLDEQYNEYVDPRIIEIMREKVDIYNQLLSIIDKIKHCETENKNQKIKMLQQLEEIRKEKYLEILYSNPAGFLLTARLTTNYRCLRNIYIQRKDHRLPEWREFCRWIETLPYAEKLLVN